MPSASTTAVSADSGPGFRGVLCVSFGRTEALAGEDTGARTRQDLSFESANPETLSQLQSLFGEARIGFRLVLAGPPADIHAAAAVAAQSGLLDEEIRLLSDGTGPLVVFCGHCHALTATRGAPGSETECHGCATTLAVSDHFSRRHGGYLGYAAHAEEAA